MVRMPEIECSTLLIEADQMLAARLLHEARERFRRAEDAGADPNHCAAGRWRLSMLLGEYDCAWQESDSIRARSLNDPERFWQGEDIAGRRVVVRCLHGYGDAVQFLRYIPMLKAIAAEVIVEVPPRFAALARCFNGIDHVITWGVDSPPCLPMWEVQIEVMELPYIFRTQLADLPLFERYLRVSKAPIFEARRSGAVRVGLAWTPGSWNPSRAISPDLLTALFSIEGCEFWSLCENSQSSPDVNPATTPLKEHRDCKENIEGLATTIAELDLVITVDTLAAHLGGALGVKTWILLPYDADWRWMHGRNDSPWYPSVQLFRQPSPGDWGSVITSVKRDLQAFSQAEREWPGAER